jgi:hypothetical protein
MKFEYGKPLITKEAHKKWYYIACVCGLEFIEARIPEVVFKSQPFHLHVELYELHTNYRLKMLDITMMTIFCM